MQAICIRKLMTATSQPWFHMVAILLIMISVTFSTLVMRDYSVYVLSQWEMVLQCNTISHWLGACTELINVSLRDWRPDPKAQHLPFPCWFVFGQFHTKILQFLQTTAGIEVTFWKELPNCLRVKRQMSKGKMWNANVSQRWTCSLMLCLGHYQR